MELAKALPLADEILTDLNINTAYSYKREIKCFIAYLELYSKPLNYLNLKAYKKHLLETRSTSATNQALAAIRFFVRELAKSEVISTSQAERIAAIENIKQSGANAGNWLTKSELESLIRFPTLADGFSLLALRDRAILSVLGGAALRRAETSSLRIEQIQERDSRWVLIDLIGKGQRKRSLPIAPWIKSALDAWLGAANKTEGFVFTQASWSRVATNRPLDFTNGLPLSPASIRNVVTRYAQAALNKHVTAHDLRRSFAKIARANNCPLEQIQVYLGHSSIKTTQIYLGNDQDFTNSPSDFLRLEI